MSVTDDRLDDLLVELSKNWEVAEHQFKSHLPVVGPFIGLFRECWNSVSTKWYVRRILQQQNHFNYLVAQSILELKRVNPLVNTDQLIQRMDVMTTLLEQELAVLEVRLEQSLQEVARLRDQLVAAGVLISDHKVERPEITASSPTLVESYGGDVSFEPSQDA